ncbi:MAG: HEAT repeat domain-containing protein [Planctomycetaceae bacterium]
MKRVLWALPCLVLGLALAGADPEAEYTGRVAVLPQDDAEAHYRLALWCAGEGLAAYEQRHYRAVVTLDPDHRAARRALGFENVAGRWVKGREAMEAKGFVEHEGAWLTREEHEHYARDAVAAARAREARKTGDEALKLCRNPDPGVRARALQAIAALEPEHRLRPLAIAARISHADVRARAVEGLGALNVKAALPPLYTRAIFDAEEAIRKAAVEAIRTTDAQGKVGPFARALASPFAPVRLHAIEALGWLGDPDGVGPLVARYEVSGGSGQSVYLSQVNQISFVQDFDVEVAQTAFIADPVIGVIQDGLVLNFRVFSTQGSIDVYERAALASALSDLTGKQLGDDPKAWTEWYRAQRKLEREAAKSRE